MRLVVQSLAAPEQILRALEDLADPSVTEVRVSVAYATYAGSKILCDVLTSKIGHMRWSEINKTIITCIDYGMTDPSALTHWNDLPNTNVLLHNVELLSGSNLVPLRAFHTKHYEFRRRNETGFATGSANLTEHALTSNTEILAVHSGVKPVSALDETWKQLLAGAIAVTPSIMSDYSKIRQKMPSAEPPLMPNVNYKPPETLWQAIEMGVCDPESFENFWVDAGSMRSGGAHNQLELPRGANLFFGLGFKTYGSTHVTIGNVTLTRGTDESSQRPLSWHGINMMERLNLPTGYEYSNTVIMFRRRDDGVFEMIVAGSESNRARAWKNTSAQSGRYFRVGGASRRTCGLF